MSTCITIHESGSGGEKLREEPLMPALKITVGETYRTRGGEKATVHGIKLKNSLGALVTFPVKCTIRKNRKYARPRYQILTLEGKARVIWGDHEDDIIALWEDM